MKLKILPENQDAFDRLVKTLKPKHKNDENFQKTMLTYLMLGGESLARHYIEVSNLDFPDVSLLLQHTPLIEPDKETDDNDLPDDDENEDEDDRDD